jgi:hypothetical protein
MSDPDRILVVGMGGAISNRVARTSQTPGPFRPAQSLMAAAWSYSSRVIA